MINSSNMDKKFLAIIPARYASTRFPAKPLAQLEEKQLYSEFTSVLQKYSLNYA